MQIPEHFTLRNCINGLRQSFHLSTVDNVLSTILFEKIFSFFCAIVLVLDTDSQNTVEEHELELHKRRFRLPTHLVASM